MLRWQPTKYKILGLKPCYYFVTTSIAESKNKILMFFQDTKIVPISNSNV